MWVIEIVTGTYDRTSGADARWCYWGIEEGIFIKYLTLWHSWFLLNVSFVNLDDSSIMFAAADTIMICTVSSLLLITLGAFFSRQFIRK